MSWCVLVCVRMYLDMVPALYVHLAMENKLIIHFSMLRNGHKKDIMFD